MMTIKEARMNIYKIITTNVTGSSYDKYYGHVIVAPDRKTVRQVASTVAADEGEEVWLDEDRAVIIELGVASSAYTEPAIILSDFLAG